MSSPKKKPPKRTEADMVKLLRKRHDSTSGNGDQFAFIPQVRDAAGFSARRTIDAYAMHLWESRGLVIDAFEIKCSRSDWLRELKDPSKAESFCEKADRFWLVVADPSIVAAGELPPTWGLLVAQGEGENAKLVQRVAAPRLRERRAGRGRMEDLPPGLHRSFLAALLRAAGRTAIAQDLQAERETLARLEEQAREHVGWELEQAKAREDEARKLVRDFEQAAGVSLSTWRRDGDESVATKVGAAVQTVLEGDGALKRIDLQLRRAADNLRATADMAERLADGEEL